MFHVLFFNTMWHPIPFIIVASMVCEDTDLPRGGKGVVR